MLCDFLLFWEGLTLRLRSVRNEWKRPAGGRVGAQGYQNPKLLLLVFNLASVARGQRRVAIFLLGLSR